MQRISDDPVSTCEVCGIPVQRVFHPVAVHFKGSGFYNTDYGTRKRSREKEAASESGSKKAPRTPRNPRTSESTKSASKDSSSSNGLGAQVGLRGQEGRGELPAARTASRGGDRLPNRTDQPQQ